MDNAPLIQQCPINLECKVVHILDLGSHSLVIGRITEWKWDVNRIKPFMYTMAPPRRQAFGEVLAKAFSIGRELEPKE